MSLTYELPTALRGKVTVPRTAELDISVKFGLWENYQQWLSRPQIEFWYPDRIIQDHKVELLINLGSKTIFTHRFCEFKTINVHHSIDDESHTQLPLTFEFLGLSSLPIRDDTGVFVSSMFEIQSLALQKISLINMLTDTLVGTDRTVVLELATPVYPWLVKNHSKLVPNFFVFPNSNI